MTTQNPEKAEESNTNIRNILLDWHRFELRSDQDNPTIELIQEAGEKNDGERREMGSVYIYDLVDFAQKQLRDENIIEEKIKKTVNKLIFNIEECKSQGFDKSILVAQKNILMNFLTKEQKAELL